MKFIKGTQEHRNECGGNYHNWLTVRDADIAAHPGSVAEPVGSFHYAACYIAREIKDGKIVDVRVIANPSQQWWDDTYNQNLIIPTMGGKIEIEPLSRWFNVFTIGTAKRRGNRALNRAVRVNMWRRARRYANNAENLLTFLRDHVRRNNKVLALCEQDDLRVD